MNYIKQLDSLRAIAVILVIIGHWIPSYHVIHRILNGAIGVDIFFVLSGFLISEILFDNRNKAELLNIPKSTVIRNFYVRRVLRIFPIYYLTICGFYIFAESTGTNIRSSFIYFVTYTSNFYFFNIQHWDGMLSHLWSLAVEEQFYLIWPWIILYVNKKYFLPIISVFIFIAVLSLSLMREIKMHDILTFNCFDAFGLGALLAWIITYANQKLKIFYIIISVVAAISFYLYIIGAIRNEWTYLPLRTIVSLITTWVITYIVINRETNSLRFKFILNNRLLIFLGKISYGLYLYHLIIPSAMSSEMISEYSYSILSAITNKKYWLILFLLECAIVLIAVSWLSFILIEKPFLNLKKYFGYQNETSYSKALPKVGA